MGKPQTKMGAKMEIRLDPEVSKVMTFQSYESPQLIDGAVYKPLKKHRALEGSFTEFLRITGNEINGLADPFEVRQISFSEAVAGRINAFHIHSKKIQHEIWCVAKGTLQVWLIDIRADSPTAGVRNKFLLSGEEPSILMIPSGIAHGYKAGVDGALLIYAMNSQFDLQDPNEGRLPWDYFGQELWETDLG